MTPGVLTYWHTLRHLRASQVLGRVRYRLARPRVDRRQPPQQRTAHGRWVTSAPRHASLVGPRRFLLLNEEIDLETHGWDHPSVARLWRYHQHYFDDLNAEGAAERDDWHRDLVAAWIAAVPPASGTGWEPYPTSLRIVNWIKWHLRCGGLTAQAMHSLAVQARWLTGRLEWHLLGNHLFSNAKALVFAGAFFDGAEADQWHRTGWQILERELPEQILPDGGHFERSPMYHGLALEDVLDLINLTRAYPDVFTAAQCAALTDRVAAMRQWLQAMCHPDGEIAFFNDATIGVSPSPAVLDAYADRLGCAPASTLPAVHSLPASGYVRVTTGESVAILDVAPVGPDYLPAHAHADTLSFEWSLRAQRVLVNSGTSQYDAGAERDRQRGTAAHNTMVVDGRDSSEVWSGFRVGRRARPFDVTVLEGDPVVVAASHDGYRRGPRGGDVRRRWTMSVGAMEVEDRAPAKATLAEARFHLHPAVVVKPGSLSRQSCDLLLATGAVVRVYARTGTLRAEASTWHPEFGRSDPSTCLIVTLDASRAVTRFEWM